MKRLIGKTTANLKAAFVKKSRVMSVWLSFLDISMDGGDYHHCHTRVITIVRISNFIRIRTRDFLGERHIILGNYLSLKAMKKHKNSIGINK